MDRGKLLIKREESGIFTLFINFLIPFGQNVNSQSLPILSRNWYNINLFQKCLLFYRLTHSRPLTFTLQRPTANTISDPCCDSSSRYKRVQFNDSQTKIKKRDGNKLHPLHMKICTRLIGYIVQFPFTKWLLYWPSAAAAAEVATVYLTH